MSLTFHSSNRLENLAEIFADNYRVHLEKPFDKEVIVVQTKGMEKWLALQVALHKGISANNEFLFPNTIIQRIFKAVLDYEELQLAFDKDSLLWEIYCQLPLLCKSNKIFEPVRKYLQDDINGVKLYQLSEKIADTFDQYQIYRPDMVYDWDKGNYWLGRKDLFESKHAWQPVLWNSIFKESYRHRASVFFDFISKISHLNSQQIDRLPSQISVFGISVIPKMYLDILTLVSMYIPVDYYTLNPCQEYWGYIRNRKEIKRAERKLDKTAEELRLEEGNELLASQGMLGREFIDMMLEIPVEYGMQEYFQDDQKGTLLSIIQSDLLNLVDVEEQNEIISFTQDDSDQAIHTESSQSISFLNFKNDQSISIHSCHSKMREMEVLHDNLVDMIQKVPELTASDILIISPDIYGYSPYIKAVFDNPSEDRLKFTYSIADVPFTREYGMIEVFMSSLKLLSGRFKASEVMALLDYEAIRKKFNLKIDDIGLIEKWLDEVGIRWGIDKSTVKDNNLPEYDIYTFRKGLKRLLLGYSIYSEGFQSVENEYIYNNFDENNADVLGKFIDFLEILFKYSKKIPESLTFSEWNNILSEYMNDLFYQSYPFDDAYIFMQKLISMLKENEDRIDSDIYASIDTVKNFVWNKYSENTSASNFISGGLTFCAMIPMRSIPFKVVCLIGMNDGTFPRQKQPMEFDLMLEQRRLGDRSPRDSDRYLFLETLISARDILYMSYVGQNIRDNSDIPPSVLVNEIIDYIDVRFNLSVEQRNNLVTKHRLQAFNKAYFSSDTPLFSYSNENKYIAEACYNGIKKQSVFFTNDFGDILENSQGANDTRSEIEMDDIIRFFQHPVKQLYYQRLGLYLGDNHSFVKDDEIFIPDNLERYNLRSEFMSQVTSGNDFTSMAQSFESFGRVPVGNVGKYYTEQFQADTEGFFERLILYLNKHTEPFKRQIPLDTGFVIAHFDHIYEDVQLFYRVANLNDKYIMMAWIQHLAMSIFQDLPNDTIVAGTDRIIKFTKMDNPAEILNQLVEVYQNGFAQPVHFFPSFSLKYPDLKGNKLGIINTMWKNSPFDGVADTYFQHCFKGESPLDDQFVLLAEKIATPLKASMEVIWSRK